MQNEKDYFNEYNEFLQKHDFEKLSYKIVGAFLVFEILYDNIYFYLIDLNNFSFVEQFVLFRYKITCLK